MTNTARVKLFVVVFTTVLLVAAVIHAKQADQGRQQPAPAPNNPGSRGQQVSRLVLARCKY